MDAFHAHFNIDQFISLIKKKENIWNYKSSSYNDKLQRYNAWISICKELVPNFDEKSKLVQKEIVAEVQSKWKVLRDGFSRSYKNIMKKGGKTSSVIKKYAYYNDLLFLKDLLDLKYQFDDSNDAESSTSANEEAGKKIRIKQKRNAEEAIIDVDGEEESAEKNIRSKQLRIDVNQATEEDILIAKLTERANEILNNPTSPSRSPNLTTTRLSDSHIPQDEDKLFLMSLQKDFSAIPEAHKLDAKFDIINVLRHYRNISSSQKENQSSQAFTWRNSNSTVKETPVSTTVAAASDKSPSHDSTYYLKSEEGCVEEEEEEDGD